VGGDRLLEGWWGGGEADGAGDDNVAWAEGNVGKLVDKEFGVKISVDFFLGCIGTFIGLVESP